MLNFKPALATLRLLGAATPLAAQAPVTPPVVSTQASLTLAFTGIERPTGAIMVALYDSEAGWTANRPVRTLMVPVSGASADGLIEGLAPGRYGAKVFHDVDGDQRMAMNPFGIPTEPFAFSNNAHGVMGPASWADAAFDLGAGATRHAITLQ